MSRVDRGDGPRGQVYWSKSAGKQCLSSSSIHFSMLNETDSSLVPELFPIFLNLLHIEQFIQLLFFIFHTIVMNNHF